MKCEMWDQKLKVFFRMCTCGVEAPPIDSMVDEDGKCEYCADDASNSTRLIKFYCFYFQNL